MFCSIGTFGSLEFIIDMIKIGIVQQNYHLGDISANTNKIIQTIDHLKKNNVDLVIFPELTITGYPPEDLLFRDGFHEQVSIALERIVLSSTDIGVVLGYPRKVNDQRFNSAAYLFNGEICTIYDKWSLPNYSVFDEKRYFDKGSHSCVFNLKGGKFGLSVCEDIWQSEPTPAAVKAGAELLINLNASPFHLGKMEQREAIVSSRAKENSIPIIYTNLVGGQDELVFDGASFVLDKNGNTLCRLPTFEEHIEIIEYDPANNELVCKNTWSHPETEKAVFDALVLGVKDYVKKNKFKGVVIGLSGGIDSALTLVIAVHALGAENVEAVMLPTRFTSDISLTDAKALANTLSVDYKIIEIETVFESFLSILSDEFKDYSEDVTEENIQARIRGVVLMAIANKKNKMVLTTGNKSEMAVGYSTLYGDMAGGFDVLKDVPKTLVFAVSEYCNRDGEIIPKRIIEREPSAELRENQTDQDSLPAYEILDVVLDQYIEQEKSIDEIIAAGFDADLVKKVTRMVDINEYKRRQAPPGVRITPKAFGRDRRYPITSGFVDMIQATDD